MQVLLLGILYVQVFTSSSIMALILSDISMPPLVSSQKKDQNAIIKSCGNFERTIQLLFVFDQFSKYLLVTLSDPNIAKLKSMLRLLLTFVFKY